MSQNNLSIAETYYKLLSEKNWAKIEKFLHPDVKFDGPLAKFKGKEAVLEGAKNFTNLYKTLKIRAKFESREQTVIVYDLECPEPIGSFSSVSLMTFYKGLIYKIELYYDARPLEKR